MVQTIQRQSVRIPRRDLLRGIGCWMCLSCLGCGAGRLPTTPVRGAVTLDGTPLGKGCVVFTPPAGPVAKGDIQPNGTFALSTYRNGDGAVVGLNNVTVFVFEREKPRAGGSALDAEVRWIVPRRYTDTGTSGLSFEVQAGQENVVTLALSTHPR